MTGPFALFDPGLEFGWSSRFDAEVFDQALLWADTNRVSDLKVKTNEVLRVRAAGFWTQASHRTVSRPEVEGVLRVVYGDNGPAELRDGNPLDFSYQVRHPGQRFGTPFRINATGCRVSGGAGIEITVRALPAEPVPWDSLEAEPGITGNLRPDMGLNLVTGPTGSGKSTLLSSAIRHICEDPDRRESVLELSAPIEYVHYRLQYPHSFVTQSEVGRDFNPRHLRGPAGIWQSALTNAMRRQPSILVIGEVRDRGGMAGCLSAALSGHLTMTTMHSPGVPETISRILAWFGQDERKAMAVDLLDMLNPVVTQKLIDRADGQGKVGVREPLVFDPGTKAALLALAAEEWPAAIRTMLRRRMVNGQSMADALKRHLNAGRISPETYEWASARTSGESGLARAAAIGNLLGNDTEN